MLSETEWIDEVLRPGATAVVTKDRDLEKNRFVWGGEALTPAGNHIQFNDANLTLGLSRLGTTSGPTPDWQSFVGIPISIDGRRYLALGLEKGHPDRKRYAYVSARYYLYPWDERDIACENIESLIDKLNTTEETISTADKPNRRRLIRSDSADIEEHRAIEASLLQSALNAYREGTPLTFRTVLLSENQFQDLEAPYMAATVPAIEQTFSEKTQTNICNLSQGQDGLSSCRQALTDAFFLSLAALTMLSLTWAALPRLGCLWGRKNGEEINHLGDISSSERGPSR